jgi:hypothetical protein
MTLLISRGRNALRHIARRIMLGAEVPIGDPVRVAHPEPFDIVGRPKAVDEEAGIAPAVRDFQKCPVGGRQRSPQPSLCVGDLLVGCCRATSSIAISSSLQSRRKLAQSKAVTRIPPDLSRTRASAADRYQSL